MKVNSLNQEMNIPVGEIGIPSREMLLPKKEAYLLGEWLGLSNRDLHL